MDSSRNFNMSPTTIAIVAGGILMCSAFAVYCWWQQRHSDSSDNISTGYPVYVVAHLPQPPMHPYPPPPPAAAADGGGAVPYLAPPGKAFTANDEHIPISYLFGDVPAAPLPYQLPPSGYYYPPPQGPPPTPLPLAAGPFEKEDPNMPAFTSYAQGAPHAHAHVPPAASPFANDPNMPGFRTLYKTAKPPVLSPQPQPQPPLSQPPMGMASAAATTAPAGGPPTLQQKKTDEDAMLTLEEALRDETHAVPAEPNGSGSGSGSGSSSSVKPKKAEAVDNID
ncbi:hypothetical protein BDZ88DRAFT_251417 [Geranomyces variabilis]|nr:hypothetical protein BDZ88DRAFT_251417 [Geranomyces variabilis]KAJ3136470.1 hypothetical protein HDU90_003182 [Geranomyces variabilis]